MELDREGLLPKGLLFSVAGARGIVGESLDANVVARLVRAFVSILPYGAIAIGRDTRTSGFDLQSAAMQAITESGRDCIDLGIAATPTVEMAVERSGAVGGIIVTASHNPAQWNALKFLDHKGVFITKGMSERLYAALRTAGERRASRTANGTVRTDTTASMRHVDAILSLGIIDRDIILKRKFRVGLDCINGAGSVIAPRLLRDLGADVAAVSCETNGRFHRDPEPRPENLQELAELVRAERCAVGFALDPDGDRLALADPERGALSEEYTLALAVDHVLSRGKGPVVVNMSTSTIIEHIAGRHGVPVLRTPVGEAHVVEAMLQHRAIVGGEGNGGVILPALHPGRDGLLGMALILQFLAERSSPLGELLDAYPPFVMKKEKTALEGPFDAAKICKVIRKQKPVTIDTRDGVRAQFDDGWFHVRVSNTEGIVRVIAEAATNERAAELIQAARSALKALWR